ALVGILSSVGYGLVLAVLSRIESATDGWGVGLKFWAPVPMRVDNFFLQILVSGAPMLAFVFAGIGIGVAFKRWGPTGLWTLSILGTLLLGGLAVLITWLTAAKHPRFPCTDRRSLFTLDGTRRLRSSSR